MRRTPTAVVPTLFMAFLVGTAQAANYNGNNSAFAAAPGSVSFVSALGVFGILLACQACVFEYLRRHWSPFGGRERHQSRNPQSRLTCSYVQPCVPSPSRMKRRRVPERRRGGSDSGGRRAP